MPAESQISLEFISSVRAKLASRRVGKSLASAQAAVACGGLQEAASVLVSFQVENLKPVPGAPLEDTREKLISVSVPQMEGGSSRQWTLTPDTRIAALRQLRETGRIQAALDANPRRPNDPIQKSLEAYLTGTAKPVEEQSLVEMTALRQVSAWVGPAGFNGVPDLATMDRRAEWLKLLQPFEHLAGSFFRGRTGELARLRSYVGIVPPGSRLESARRSVVEFFSEKSPLLIFGPGGVGKSTLLSRFILEHARALESDRFPFVYLDFDRPEITAAEPLTLLIEAVRQLGIEYPDAHERCERIRQDWLQLFRSVSAPKPTPDEADPASSSPPPMSVSSTALSAAIRDFVSLISSVRAADRPVVMVLDTFEEVQWRSEEQVAVVWSLLDQLRPAVERLCVIVAGRAPVAGRKTEEMELKGFDTESAVGYLEARGVSDPELAAQIASLVGGSPMNLQLAADLVVREGIRSGSELGISTREFFFIRLDDAQIQRQLHKRVLAQIHDERVRQIASPGLVLRRITPELIFEVLNKPCSLKLTKLEEAKPLFEELRREVSLVRQDSDGSLVHRTELRIQTLALLRQDQPQKATEIHQAAVDYYERHSVKPSDRAEEIYHRLSLGQEPDLVEPRWMAGVEPYLQDAFDEFSGSIRAYLATRLGKEVDEQTRNLASLQDWEDIVRRKATDLLAQGESQQALDLLAGRTDRSFQSPLFTLEATALSHLGRWPDAFALLDRGINQALRSGARRQVLALALQAADMALASKRSSDALWLVSRIQALSQTNLQPEDRVAIIARKIALARIDLPFRADPANNLEGNLRKAFDELSDQDLARRRDIAWWAATGFQAEDVPRLLRVLKNAGVPRVGVDLELRELATRITSFDFDVSKDLGELPGALAKELGVPLTGGLTASWSEFLLRAPPPKRQDALCRLLEAHGKFVSKAEIQAFSNLMRAAVGISTSTPASLHAEEKKPSTLTGKDAGPLLAMLLDALLRCFPSPIALKLFLQSRLDWSLDSIAADGPLRQRMLEVIHRADTQGSLIDLVESARQANPSDAGLAQVAAELGVATLAPRTSVFEVLVANDPLMDITQWREKLGLIEGQVCRVEVADKYFGTAFLVGPDLILTADHVLSPVHDGSARPADVKFRFDYKTAKDRIISQGTVFTLADDWLVARSEHHEGSGGLDYSLLRVRNSPGTQPIGGARAESSAALRKWIALDPPETLTPGDRLIIVQHPRAGPLKLSVGTLSTVGVSDDTRVFYDVRTEPGSAGAPCLTMEFRLAALHIGRLPVDRSPLSGVPYGTVISAVVVDLLRKGLGNVVGSRLL